MDAVGAVGAYRWPYIHASERVPATAQLSHPRLAGLRLRQLQLRSCAYAYI